MASLSGRGKRPAADGQVRLSQVVSTFGPGSMVDLPKHSVLISGLDFWKKPGPAIDEPRLAETAARLLGVPTVELGTPPAEDKEASLPVPHIPAFQFPEWFLTQDLEPDEEPSRGKTRLLVHRKTLTRGQFIDIRKKRRKVVPVRWVRACKRGHIGDIDWMSFVHGAPKCPDNMRQLYLDERGTSGDLSAGFVRCECGTEMSMIIATNYKARSLGRCDGYRPWLGPAAGEKCDEPNRLLIRAASNSYFTQAVSVISLPERDMTVRDAVASVWNYLQVVKDEATLTLMLGIEDVKRALSGLGSAEVLAAIEARRNPAPPTEKPVKLAELETLVAAEGEMGYDVPDGNFYAKALPDTAWNGHAWMEPIERVVLVHRLREVVAQIGFTRFESATADINGDLDLGVERAALSRETTWVPSYENRGEGIFLQFRAEALEGMAGPGSRRQPGSAVGTRIQAVVGRASGVHTQVSIAGVLGVALVFSFAVDCDFAGMRVCGVRAAGAGVRVSRGRVRGFGLYGDLGCGGHAGRVDRSGAADFIDGTVGAGDGATVFQRPGLRPASAIRGTGGGGQFGAIGLRGTASARVGVPWVFAGCGDELRADE